MESERVTIYLYPIKNLLGIVRGKCLNVRSRTSFALFLKHWTRAVISHRPTTYPEHLC